MTLNPIKWSDEFSVGIESIDEQHKKLVNMIGTLHDAIADGKALEVLDEIFNGLYDYIDYHFTYEEELVEKYHHPDAETHKKEHAAFNAQLTKFKSKMEDGDHFMGEVLLLKFLQDWLINHIMKSDKKYSYFLIVRGVK